MQGISKTLKFVVSLAIVLGLAGYYVYYTFKAQPESLGGITTIESSDTSIFGEDYREVATILNNLQFDTAFLTDPTFTSLVDFYREPEQEAAGVPNPFVNF
jgi:hypothetical protein